MFGIVLNFTWSLLALFSDREGKRDVVRYMMKEILVSLFPVICPSKVGKVSSA